MSASRSGCVVHIVPAAFQQGTGRGGAERYALELASHMAQRRPTRLVAFGPEPAAYTTGELEVRVIGGDWSARGRAHDPIGRGAVREMVGAGVVHCHQRQVRFAKLAAVVGRVTRTPCFVTDHGGGAWGLGTLFPADRLFTAHLDVSAFSRAVGGTAASCAHEVIGCGVDVERFVPALHAADRPRRVLFVGRLVPHKGVDALIEALPAGVGLDVVGPPLDPAYVDELRALARDRDVAFHHDWDDAQLVRGYQECLCTVLPSVYRDRYGGATNVPELVGQTLLESMACGRPVICTPVGGMPEIVRDGVTGIIVPERDRRALAAAIGKLDGDAAAADRMGAAGREHAVGEHRWEEVVERCLHAYARAGR